MAGGINKVILVGNLGQDPDMRYMPNGNAVANITVATSETWKDQQGQRQERTEWHRVVLFRRLGEIAGEYLKKGAKVYIEGKLQTRKWKDQNGQERYTTEIIADQMQMLDSRSNYDGASNSYQHRSEGGQPTQQHGKPAPHPTGPDGKPVTHNTGGPGNVHGRGAQNPGQNFTPDLDEGWDDDIPFAPIGKQYPRLLTCI